MVLFVITSVPEPVPFLLTSTFCFSCFSILEPLAATLPVIYFLKSWGGGGGGGGGVIFSFGTEGDVKKNSYDCCGGMWKNDAHLKNIVSPSCSINNKYSLIQH